MSRRIARNEDQAGPPKLADDNFYDNEAAQTAFFNAPKVTVRSNRRPKAKNKETDDEEEADHETYDENADKELNEKIAQHLKDFFAKKITAKNAFETPILDKLPTVAEMEPLQCVGAMLDASARVYAFRVDNTHCECFTVRTNFDEEKKKKGKENDSMDEDDEGGGGANGSDDDGEDGGGGKDGAATKEGANAREDGGADAPNGDGSAPADASAAGKTKKKKKGLKGSHDAELPGRLDDLYKKSGKLVDRFVRYTLPAREPGGAPTADVTEEHLAENFDNFSSKMHDLVISRRVGVPFIEQKMLGLNRTVEEYSIDDPIYHKVAKQFEEGCAQSFVNNEVLTNATGNFLILHTNWRHNEPYAGEQTRPATAVEFQANQQNSELLECVEASLERALAPNPCDLPLLQQFCEEEDENKSEKEEKNRSGIRLLGRKSQDPAKIIAEGLAPNQSPRKSNLKKVRPDSDNDDDGEGDEEDETASSMSLTEDEKARREHEELAKFQMYLDEDVVDEKADAAHDPFEGQCFFSDNFANFYLKNEAAAEGGDGSCEAHKAILHALSDSDAQMFGIPVDLLIEIKNELKVNRRLSEAVYRRLISQIPVSKLADFNAFVKGDALCVEGKPEDGAAIGAPSSFLVTRFAPLIDSIWHAVIKAGGEEDLAKTGVFGGASRNMQRMLNRQAHNATHHQKSASKRRKPHVTPSKASSNTSSAASSLFTTPIANGKSTLRRGDTTAVKATASTSKRRRVGGGVAVGGDEFEDEGVTTDSQYSEMDENAGTPKLAARLIADMEQKERIYFWARPRQYPTVYLGQITDERDNPMLQQGVEMCVDMEEMLLGLDEAKANKQRASTTAAVECNGGGAVGLALDDATQGADADQNASATNAETLRNDGDATLVMNEADGTLTQFAAADSGPNASQINRDAVNNFDFAEIGADFNDAEEQTTSATAPLFDIFDEPPAPILDNLDGDMNDVDDCADGFADLGAGDDEFAADLKGMAAGKDAAAMAEAAAVEDHSHWKGADTAVGNNVNASPTNDIKKEQKLKKEKKAPTKPKRRRLNSDINSEMGGSLTKDMFWQPIDEADPDTIKSIRRHQTIVAKATDIVHNIVDRRKSGEAKLFWEKRDFPLDVSGDYNPIQLIQAGLFFQSNLGFWRYEKREKTDASRGPVFYARGDRLQAQSLDEQCDEFLNIYFRHRVKTTIKGEPLADAASGSKMALLANYNPYSLDIGSPPGSDGGRHDFGDDDDGGVGEFGGLGRLNECGEGFGDVDGMGDGLDANLLNGQNSEWKMEEHLEFNGGVIKIHQSRVKAPLVKRAISTILASREMDQNTLVKLRAEYSKERHAHRTLRLSDKENQTEEANGVDVNGVIGDEITASNDVSQSQNGIHVAGSLSVVEELVNGDAQNDVHKLDHRRAGSESSSSDGEGEEGAETSSSSASSDEEEEEEEGVAGTTNANNNVSGVRGLNATVDGGFSIRGEHTFESLLAHLPHHLSGRTKHDLNVINAFAITLHMCNEHQIRLEQEKEEDTLLVKPDAMASFKFKIADNSL